MKNIFKTILCICLLFTAFNCSNENDELITEATRNLEERFENHSLRFDPNNLEKIDLNKANLLLDQTKNYQNTIYASIVNKDNTKPTLNTNPININYTNPTDFDKFLVKELLNNLLNDDISVFFNRANHYQEFVEKNINDSSQYKFLSNIIEQFKWIKYGTASKLAPLGDDGCFDRCMIKKIKDNFDDANVVDWVAFLLSAGETVAWWTGSCIWECHF